MKIYVDAKTKKSYSEKAKEKKIRDMVDYLVKNPNFDPLSEDFLIEEEVMNECEGFYDWMDGFLPASEVFCYTESEKQSLIDCYKGNVEDTIRRKWDLIEVEVEI